MELTLNNLDEEPRIRPTLLTVLCILTFIGSGSGIISNTYSYVTAHKTVKMFSPALERLGDSTQTDSTARHLRKNQTMFSPRIMLSLSKILTEENIRRNAIGVIISCLCTLLGAVLMWHLRRSGFYLYVGGIIVGLVVPFYLYGNNLLAVGIFSFSSFAGLVFIALYALNIKSLR